MSDSDRGEFLVNFKTDQLHKFVQHVSFQNILQRVLNLSKRALTSSFRNPFKEPLLDSWPCMFVMVLYHHLGGCCILFALQGASLAWLRLTHVSQRAVPGRGLPGLAHTAHTLGSRDALTAGNTWQAWKTWIKRWQTLTAGKTWQAWKTSIKRRKTLL